MREMGRHVAGRIFLAVLALSVLGMLVLIGMGLMEAAPGKPPLLVFGWMTLPLVAGVVFVIIWLIAYLVYFFKFCPYR